MRTQVICLALAVALMCPFASAQWVQTKTPPTEATPLAVNDTLLFAITQDSLWRSTDSGDNWTLVNDALFDTLFKGTSVLEGVVATASHFFALVAPKGVYRSRDNGNTWVAVNNGLDTTMVNDGLAAVGQNLFACGYSGYYGNNGCIFQSTNDGDIWEKLKWPDSLGVSALTVQGTNLFAGTYSGYFKFTTGHGVFRSTDSGASWAQANQGLPDYSYVNAFAIAGTTVFAGIGRRGVYRSTNDGDTWTGVNAGLLDTVSVWAFVQHGTSLFAVAYVSADNIYRVFCSNDNGDKWKDVSEGLPTFSAYDLTSNSTYLFVGIPGAGVWRRPLSEMITAVELSSGHIPVAFELQQNYPNPFNPSTTIKYELPKSSVVRLSVYDILGREVSVLVDEAKQPGTHAVQFDGNRLASGMYFYRIQAGSFVETRKLLLLR
jgi:photosystem II stability/assembly factor-like uncharacterized protein